MPDFNTANRTGFHNLLIIQFMQKAHMNEKITFGERFGYGLDDLASCLFWMQFVWFLNYFYTDVFGLAPSVLATMILVVRI